MDLLGGYGSDEAENDSAGPSVPLPAGENDDRRPSGVFEPDMDAPGTSGRFSLAENSAAPAVGVKRRTFAHVEGNYATHIFIAIQPTPEAQSFLSSALSAAKTRLRDLEPMFDKAAPPSGPGGHGTPPRTAKRAKVAPGVAPAAAQAAAAAAAAATPRFGAGPFHLSLSRAFPVRFRDIEGLRLSLREALEGTKEFRISLEGWAALANDDRSRSFLVVPVSAGSAPVVHMIRALDKALLSMGLPAFHKDPKPHVSVAWALGDRVSDMETLTSGDEQPEAAAGQGPARTPASLPAWSVPWEAEVREAWCLTGDKHHRIWP